jgi:hypothetical protein
LRIEGVVSVTHPYGRILGFLDRTNNNNSNKKENTKNSEAGIEMKVEMLRGNESRDTTRK